MKQTQLIVIFFALVHGIGYSQQKLTLEEAVTGQFRQFAPSNIAQLNWMGESDVYAYEKENTLWMGKIKGKTADSKIMSLEELNAINGGEPLKNFPMINWLSPDRFYYDHGTGYVEVDMKSKKSVKYCSYGENAANADYHSSSHQLAYTIDNNLHVIVGGNNIAVTNNSAEIISGQSISRNEYGIVKGTFWSPDGSKLAFYQKNEMNVTDYPLVNYKDTPATVRMIKYPMAGGKSEFVGVGIFDITSQKTTFLNLDEGKPNDQFYATNLTWSPDNKTVYIAWLNRATTDMKFIAFDASSGKKRLELFSEHDDKWVEPLFPAYFLPKNPDQFLWISQRDGFNNLYLYDTKGTLLRKTSVNFDITDLLDFDMKGENAFVMATGEFPTESNCYKVNLADMSLTKVSIAHGTHRAMVSGSGSFVIDQFSNLTTPNKIDVVSHEGRLVKNLLIATDPYAGRSIGKTELFTIPAKDGTELWCRMIKPSDFDEKKKYPVLVYVYGGPHAQMVTNSSLGGASLWMNQLAEEGFIVFTCDNRGSSNRGKNFQQVIHRQLGVVEMEDQLTAVNWLKKQPYVAINKMAIHGWSFGGFMTTNLMLKSPGTFKVGVAGGPVIDWSMYEVMYGERYMDTPQENPEGYQQSDLTKYVKELKGDLLMIHGMDDDVVVMQHNVKFLKACVDSKVQVDFFAYPGHPHNVRGKDRVHLMTKVIEYIKQNLEE